MEKGPFGGVTNLEGMVSRIESREVESSSMYLTNTRNSSVESIYPIHNSVVGGSSSIVNSGAQTHSRWTPHTHEYNYEVKGLPAQGNTHTPIN